MTTPRILGLDQKKKKKDWWAFAVVFCLRMFLYLVLVRQGWLCLTASDRVSA